MADLADLTENNDFTREVLTRARANALNSVKHPPGICLNCGDTTKDKTLYCDEFCREDYEEAEALKQITRRN